MWDRSQRWRARSAVNRNRVTRSAPIAASIRARNWSPISSNSCAQAPLSQAIVTRPSRSATGSARAAICGPQTPGQAAWTSASSVCGARSETIRSKAPPSLRGPAAAPSVAGAAHAASPAPVATPASIASAVASIAGT